MASGFMLADALNEALRLPYMKGNARVTSDYLVNGLRIGEHRILLKKNFDTACWIPPVGKQGSHSIYYGDHMLMRVIDFFCKKNSLKGVPEEIPEKLKDMCDKTALFDQKVNWLKHNLSEAQWTKLLETLIQAVAAYGRHEREHARNTSQNLKQTNRDLRLLGIPFMLFNLFEDSRIEHRSRQELGVPFGWLDIEEIASSKEITPVLLYLRCIQLEGTPDAEMLACSDSFGVKGERTVGEAAGLVQGFYQRACECPTDEHLYPIMVEFLKIFHEDMPNQNPQKGGSGQGGESEESGSGAGERSGDLSTAAQAAQEGDSFFETFDEDAQVVGGTDQEGKNAEGKAKAALGDSKNAKARSQGTPDSVTPDGVGGKATPAHFLASQPDKLGDDDLLRVDLLTKRLLQLFKTHSLNQAQEAIGQRMSSRHLARGEVRYLHRKTFGGKGKRKYTIVYDCSGSMFGPPDKEGKLFLLALNNLAKRGFLQGNLILSGFVGSSPAWLSYRFPLPAETILSIYTGHRAEGLKFSLEGNLKLIKGMDDVFVYTDACICDAPLDHSFFAKEKIWPVGLYVGSEEDSEHMARHFPQYIIRNTIEELVEKMLVRNRRSVG